MFLWSKNPWYIIEGLAFKSLRCRNSYVIKPEDKGGAVFVWRADLYRQETLRQLNDASFYTKLNCYMQWAFNFTQTNIQRTGIWSANVKRFFVNVYAATGPSYSCILTYVYCTFSWKSEHFTCKSTLGIRIKISQQNQNEKKVMEHTTCKKSWLPDPELFPLWRSVPIKSITMHIKDYSIQWILLLANC